MWLWMWTENKTRNLELLLGAVDFVKFLVMEDFKHYELHKVVERNRIGFGPVMDSEGVISILIQIILQS